MNEFAKAERLDTLLALALVSQQQQQHDAQSVAPHIGNTEPAANGLQHTVETDEFVDAHQLFAAGAPLEALAVGERDLIERRAAKYKQLSPEEQTSWLRRTLRRAQRETRAAFLDEHVHPSHIIEALRFEPRRAQLLITQHLPQALARQATAALGIKLLRTERRGTSAPQTGSEQRKSEERRGGTERRTPMQKTLALDPSLIAVVRRAFLSHFAALDSVNNASPLDRLSGAELARLVRLLGVREVALACRGVTRIEAIASFLRRFSPEDARAIAAHIAAFTDVEARRINFAEQVAQASLNSESDTRALLDRVGLSLLAIRMLEQDSLRLRYTEQKLPVEAARGLRRLLAEWRERIGSSGNIDRNLIDSIANEVEALAKEIRRASKKTRSTA